MTQLQYGLELTHPGWLLAVGAVPWLVWYFRRSLVDFAKWQKAISLGVRIAIVLLLVLALAGLTLLKPTDRQFVIVVLDQSVSVGNEPLPGAKAVKSEADRFWDAVLAANTLGREDKVVFLPFAAKPAAVRSE